jgi:catechol 2,3-dioxygenase-like lactoylglutathione lyase family enzyme
MFKATHPIIGTRDIERAIAFYTNQLGFTLAFADTKTGTPNYIGFRRDAVELHMQFQYEHEMSTMRLRLLVEDPDALCAEFRQRGIECPEPQDKPWGTREFGLHDPDGNAFIFYRNLTKPRETGGQTE